MAELIGEAAEFKRETLLSNDISDIQRIQMFQSLSSEQRATLISDQSIKATIDKANRNYITTRVSSYGSSLQENATITTSVDGRTITVQQNQTVKIPVYAHGYPVSTRTETHRVQYTFSQAQSFDANQVIDDTNFVSHRTDLTILQNTTHYCRGR